MCVYPELCKIVTSNHLEQHGIVTVDTRRDPHSFENNSKNSPTHHLTPEVTLWIFQTMTSIKLPWLDDQVIKQALSASRKRNLIVYCRQALQVSSSFFETKVRSFSLKLRGPRQASGISGTKLTTPSSV